jgi:gliding motility-associated-like protein
MKFIRALLFIGVLHMFALQAYGIHIKGGWMYYEYEKTEANGDITYRIVVKLYRDCVPPTANQNDAQIIITVFKNNGTFAKTTTAGLSRSYRLQKSTFSECINPKPEVCYVILEYAGRISLPPVTGGYIAAFQRCCRINGIVNVEAPSNTFGNTYTIKLPGSETPNGVLNTSPKFVEKDTVAVCYNSPIELDYSATDPDGDSLVYSFTSALVGASQGTPSPGQSPPPPYSAINYESPYAAYNPFGTGTVINPSTGIITGMSPRATGEYVLAVLIKEYRNGTYIAETRKELHVNVAACSIAGAELPLRITSCDGYTVQFENLSTSPAINSYYWDFGEKTLATDTSTQPRPSYTYSDTGVFTAKLVVNKNSSCADSATSEVRVFPGFFPDFNFTGSCFSNPFQFNDQSTTRYGVIDSWRWDFGDNNTQGDTSHIKNPPYLYPGIGSYTATLMVTSNKGCGDTITKQVPVIDKPLLDMGFRDTLICSIDSLVLKAIGTGNFTWTPTLRMILPNTATPTVFPLQTTTYRVTLNDRGCRATDTVRVNVLDFITVNAGNDSTICRTDGVQLMAVSQGLQYQWTPALGLSDPGIKNPVAIPLSPSNTYRVTVNLGKCQATDDVTIKTVPYPASNGGSDTAICFNDTITLRGSGSGISYQWSPANTVAFPNQLVTPAFPTQTTPYVLSVYAAGGCPKPGRDTVLVTVVPPLSVFAGNDTSVVVGQPLQLNGISNGSIFSWSPGVGMNNTQVSNPIVVLDGKSIPGGADQIRYLLEVTTPEGCISSDDIVVKLFKTIPSIFVPNAFTPNLDGKNDDIKPILAGMKQLLYFRVYNRYGQLIFETKQPGKGWDGRVKGEFQNTSAFVYACQAQDFNGKLVQQSGTFVLIR